MKKTFYLLAGLLMMAACAPKATTSGLVDRMTHDPDATNTETILQWKRQCEVEMQKRGLHFHDMGHGWTAEPYGLVSNGSWETMDSIP